MSPSRCWAAGSTRCSSLVLLIAVASSEGGALSLRCWVARWEICRRGWTHCTRGKISRRSWEVCCLLNNVLERLRLIQSSNYCTFLLIHMETSDTSKKQLLSKSRVNAEDCGQGWRGPGGVSQSLQWESKGSGQSRCIQRVNMWLPAELLLLWPQELFSGTRIHLTKCGKSIFATKHIKLVNKTLN